MDATVSWGHQGHDEQRAAAIIGAQLGYASLKNALAFALKQPQQTPETRLKRSIITRKTHLLIASDLYVDVLAPAPVNT